MNTRIFRALLLEHATRSWPFLAAGPILGVLFVLPFMAEGGPVYQNELEPTAQGIAIVIAMLGLLYSAADGERLTCELTQRTLLLPVPTMIIVSVKFVYNTVCIFLLSLLIHTLLRLTVSPPHDDWWAYPVLSVTIFLVLQTLALAVGCLGDWSFGILVAAFFTMMGYADDHAANLADNLVAVEAGLFGGGLLLSCAVVHLRRTGRWDPQLLLPRLARTRTQTSEKNLAPFKSAFEAQRWFETRRMRLFLLMTWVAMGPALFLSVVPRTGTERFLEDYSKTDRFFWAIGHLGMALPFIFVLAVFFVGGVMFFQNYRMQLGPLRAFLYLRPMSTTDLARARIAGTLRGLGGLHLLTAFLSIGLMSFWTLIDKENPSSVLLDRWNAAELTGILTLVFLGVAAAAWAAYWTGSIFIAVVLYALYVPLALPWAFLDYLGWVDAIAPIAYERIGMIGAALFMCAILALAVRRGHVSPARLGTSLLIANAFSFTFWFATYWDDIWSARDVNWSLIDFPVHVLFALFIALPVATIPLTLHWARHR